jgi:hypothetical protein
MTQFCIGNCLQVNEGVLDVKLDPSNCDIKPVCGLDGLRVEHSLNRLVLRNFNNTQVISPPGGILVNEAYGAQYEWDTSASDVVDGTGFSHVGHTIVLDRAGFCLITANFRVRANTIAEGVGQHMLNFNIRINGVRRGGDIRPYAAPFSHRATNTFTSNLSAGDVVDVEFADEPTSGVTAIAWQLEPDARNEFSITRLQSACPVPIL